MSTHDYAEAVVAGELVAGPHVRAACERHIRDLERKDLVFDEEKAERAIGFFPDVLRLSAGEYEGVPFDLLLWQAFCVGSLFGWYTHDGRRRFRRGYLEIAKGSGKSPLAGGIGLLMTFADGEPRAESYVLARTAEQTEVTFRPTVAMVHQSPILEQRLTVSGGSRPYNIADPQSMSFLRRISSDQHGKGKSGPIPHLILCDEYHEHDTTAMLEFYDAGTKNRRRPLTLIITNAGAGMDSPCGLEHSYAIRVADGAVENDAYFSFVCSLDDADEPFEDESCWIKANPSLPAIPGYDYIRDQVDKARGMPSKRALVERLNFCVWTDAEAPWLSRDRWLAVETKELPAEIEDAPCYIALDLALKTDLTAGALVWNLSDGDTKRYAARVKVWTPGDTLDQRSARDAAPYREWAEAGYLTVVDGPVATFAAVVVWIAQVRAQYSLRGVAYDPWNIDLLEEALDAAGIVTTRSARSPGLLLAPHGQGFYGGGAARPDPDKVPLYMPRSIDALEGAILSESIEVEYNPALRWAALGAVVISDASENRRLTKKKAVSRIDAMVALTMATGFAAAKRPVVRSRGVEDFTLGQVSFAG